MFDGNRFFPETGIPILNSARTSVELDVWLPDPLTVATVKVKSFTTSPAESGRALSAGLLSVGMLAEGLISVVSVAVISSPIWIYDSLS
jgi:hypothetical protein